MTGLLSLLALGCAGALGALARYGVAEWTARRWMGQFPLATFAINVTGAFALGLLLTSGGATPALAQWRLVLGTGFLGGYTTFSTLSWETYHLQRNGRWTVAWTHGLGTLVVGAGAAALGMVLGAAIST